MTALAQWTLKSSDMYLYLFYILEVILNLPYLPLIYVLRPINTNKESKSNIWLQLQELGYL